MYSREMSDKALVISPSLLYTRLLEDDLAKPDTVRVGFPLPGHGSGIFGGIPPEQLFGKIGLHSRPKATNDLFYLRNSVRMD
jgi:hypothetical protein